MTRLYPIGDIHYHTKCTANFLSRTNGYSRFLNFFGPQNEPQIKRKKRKREKK